MCLTNSCCRYLMFLKAIVTMVVVLVAMTTAPARAIHIINQDNLLRALPRIAEGLYSNIIILTCFILDFIAIFMVFIPLLSYSNCPEEAA
jgi:hypothetical protein